MVSHHGTNWHGVLPFVEFAHATCVATSFGFSPFEVGTGRKPHHPSAIGDTSVGNGDAHSFAEKRMEIVTQARASLLEAQRRQKDYYDRGRRDVQFEAGDWVLLNAALLAKKYVQETKTTKMLLPKFVGPF